MIHRDRARFPVQGNGPVERLGDLTAGHTLSHLQDRTPATPLVHDRQHPKRPSVERRIVHEIHAPALSQELLL